MVGGEGKDISWSLPLFANKLFRSKELTRINKVMKDFCWPEEAVRSKNLQVFSKKLDIFNK